MSRGFNLDDYITVQARIAQFWADHPAGRIETDLMSDPTDFTTCRFIARVFKQADDPTPAATGWAFEHAGERGPNLTSHEENCETSAIGRALANMGYATSQADRPSREEMAKVQRLTPEPTPAHETPGQAKARIVRDLKGPLTRGALNLIEREVDKLGLGEDAEVGPLLYEAQQRRDAATKPTTPMLVQ